MGTSIQTGLRARHRSSNAVWLLPPILALMAITGLVLAAPAVSDSPVMPAAASAREPHSSPAVHVGPVAAQSCAECHRFDPAGSHPVGVVPSMRVPKGLPLSDGKISCATCHTTPASAAERPSPSLLREAAAGLNLCTSCHAASPSTGAGSGRRMNHAGAAILAHPAADPSATRSAPRASNRGAIDLDRQSRSCLSCHDGSLAGDGGAHTARASAADGTGQDHPMGVPYNDRSPRNPEVRLVPRASLNPAVPLFNQSVGCGSCHNVYSKQNGLLVMSNVASRLCMACHVQ